MMKDWSGKKRRLELFKGCKGVVGEDERSREIVVGTSMEGKTDGGVMGDEASVEVGETEPGLDLFDGFRNWPGCDRLKFLRIHANAVLANDEAKIFDLGPVKFAFFDVSDEVVFVQGLKDVEDVTLVLGKGVGEDEDIVEVDNSVDIEHLSKDPLDE